MLESIENKFFIFTCVHNEKSLIGNLFKSLLNQKYTNFVHYIYDDASTDDISDIVNEYKDRASHLHRPYLVVYEKGLKNIGNLASTKHCLEIMGKYRDCNYFGWINADDFVSEKYLEVFNKLINKHKDYSIFMNYRIPIRIVNNKIIINKRKEYNNKTNLTSGYKLIHLLQNAICYTPFVASINFYYSNKMNLVLGDNTYLNDDQIYTMYALCDAKFYYSKYAMYYALMRKTSVSHGTYYDTFWKQYRDDISKTLSVLNKDIDIIEIQKNTAIFRNILDTNKITRREIFSNIIKYFKFKKYNLGYHCVLVHKFRIFACLISPSLAKHLYLKFKK